MSDYEDYEFQDLDQTQEQSPGLKILSAVDSLVPKLTPSALTVLSIRIVEDISLDFPDVKITLGRALFKLPNGSFQEVLLPQINGLVIINSPTLFSLKDRKYTKIPEDLITNDKMFAEQDQAEWFPKLMQEIYEALSDYMLSMPIDIDTCVTYRTNFTFTIPAGDKRKINTNFRWPKYFGIPFKLDLTPENCTLKRKAITAFFDKPDRPAPSMEKIGALFPTPGITGTSGAPTIKSDNSRIITWVEDHLSIDIVDYCYDGIFSPVDLESRIQFTVLNNTENDIEFVSGTKMVEMQLKIEKNTV